MSQKFFPTSVVFFYESHNQKDFAAAGIDTVFIQDNHSRSARDVLRGLHLQKPGFAQTKLVRCTQGEIYDVAVDMRKNSPTFKQWFGLMLSAENKKQFYIPKGFAHGFAVLSATAELQYKCDAYYAPQAEAGILWNDPDLNIDWPVAQPVISAKDRQNPRLKDLPGECFF